MKSVMNVPTDTTRFQELMSAYGRPITLLYIGVCGSLLPRFVAGSIRQVAALHPLEIIGADQLCYSDGMSHLASTKDAGGKRLIDLPWAEPSYLGTRKLVEAQNGNGSLRLNGRSQEISAAFIATPTHSHLGYGWQCLDNGIPVVAIEKPFCCPSQLGQSAALQNRYPKSTFGTDFFLDRQAMFFLAQLLPRLGKIQKLASFCVEPGTVEQEERGWLMIPQLSGGGTLADCASHNLAQTGYVLQQFGHSLGEMTVTSLLMGRYSGASCGLNIETAAWLAGKVADIDVEVYVGKAVGARWYGIVVTGDQGTAEISIGTETHPPYIRLALKNGPTTIYLFSDLPYELTIQNLILAVIGQDGQGEGKLAIKDRFTMTRGSIAVIAEAYRMFSEGGQQPNVYQMGQPLADWVRVPEIPAEVPQIAESGFFDR